MDLDADEDRQLGFEVKLKQLDNADDDYRAADASSTLTNIGIKDSAIYSSERKFILTASFFEDNICRHFAKGKCSNYKCPDLHIKVKTTVCKHWLNSLCKKNRDCEFLHRYDLTKMPICHFWTEHRECNNGTDCVFLHVDEESSAEDCVDYAQGFCKLGPRCKQRHRKFPICERYLIGFCPDGPSCKFGHPK